MLHLETASTRTAYTQSSSRPHPLEQMGYRDRQVRSIVNIFIQVTLREFWQGGPGESQA